MKTNTKENTLMKGRIKIELFDEAGNLKDKIEKDNTFMAAGDAHVADQLAATPDEAAMGWLSVGTGSTAFTTSSTVLNSEIDRNALSGGYPEQQAGGADNDVVYKASWAAGDATGAITEAGIFNSSAADAGTMLAASTFSVINKGASDECLSALEVILRATFFKFGETLEKFFKTIPSQALVFAREGVTT